MPNYITYSGDPGDEELLPPPIVMWWWKTGVLGKIDQKDFLFVVDDNHRACGHLIGWMEETPMVLLCHLGSMDLVQVKAEMQHAVTEPFPTKYASKYMEQMLSGINAGLPLFIHEEVESIRQRQEKETAILNVKEAQAERRERRLAEKAKEKEEKRLEREQRSQELSQRSTKRAKPSPKPSAEPSDAPAPSTAPPKVNRSPVEHPMPPNSTPVCDTRDRRRPSFPTASGGEEADRGRP